MNFSTISFSVEKKTKTNGAVQRQFENTFKTTK